jgi:hypothetical protein
MVRTGAVERIAEQSLAQKPNPATDLTNAYLIRLKCKSKYRNPRHSPRFSGVQGTASKMNHSLFMAPLGMIPSVS